MAQSRTRGVLGFQAPFRGRGWEGASPRPHPRTPTRHTFLLDRNASSPGPRHLTSPGPALDQAGPVPQDWHLPWTLLRLPCPPPPPPPRQRGRTLRHFSPAAPLLTPRERPRSHSPLPASCTRSLLRSGLYHCGLDYFSRHLCGLRPLPLTSQAFTWYILS